MTKHENIDPPRYHYNMTTLFLFHLNVFYRIQCAYITLYEHFSSTSFQSANFFFSFYKIYSYFIRIHLKLIYIYMDVCITFNLQNFHHFQSPSKWDSFKWFDFNKTTWEEQNTSPPLLLQPIV